MMIAGGGSIGQFHPASSPLHALDPRAKLLAAAMLVVGLFLVDSMAGMALVLAAVAGAAAASRVPPAAFGRLLRPVLFIVALTALFQVLFSREGPLLFGWGPLEVHQGGVRMGVFLALRIALLVSSAALVTATTSPVALADALEDLLSPLRRLRFPVHEMAMMMTIALRFIPTLDEEAQKIMRAQAARGADFSEGGAAGRLRAVLPVLVPLVVGAFRRADELAEAMESRGYRGGEGRTRYRELRFGPRDGAALAVVVIVLGGAVAL
ncbi:energy-coupling factor transporter transmembrane component T family protein [Rubrobacter xylanophilus]|nr:energy-coupling factor transporter transmembrane component T [Rubrobacter xylanophilus]